MFLGEVGSNVFASFAQVVRIGTGEPPIDFKLIAYMGERITRECSCLIADEDIGRSEVPEPAAA